MARSKLDRFDHLLPCHPESDPWRANGEFAVDPALLQKLLGVAVGSSQTSGMVAAAADLWAAEELRRGGFEPDDVWPRRTTPRVYPRDVRNLVEQGLTTQLRRDVEARFPRSRRALPTEARVLGAAYTKQADVLIASWPAGIELLISTKTMLSSYAKNLRNRFEEGYGDAKNLRGRHPLAALGFLFVLGGDASAADRDFAIDMLRKLAREPDVYDACCLIVLETKVPIEEEDRDRNRGPEEDASLAPSEARSVEGDGDGEADEPVPAPAYVNLPAGLVPPDLWPNVFFETMVRRLLERTPVAMYPEVRRRSGL